MTPEYFKVLRASLVRGRFFAEDDEPGKQLVVIVDETTARTFWPDRDPIGRRLGIGRTATAARAATTTTLPWSTIVGVIADIKNDGLDQSGSDLPGSRNPEFERDRPDIFVRHQPGAAHTP